MKTLLDITIKIISLLFVSYFMLSFVMWVWNSRILLNLLLVVLLYFVPIGLFMATGSPLYRLITKTEGSLDGDKGFFLWIYLIVAGGLINHLFYEQISAYTDWADSVIRPGDFDFWFIPSWF